MQNKYKYNNNHNSNNSNHSNASIGIRINTLLTFMKYIKICDNIKISNLSSSITNYILCIGYRDI